MIMQTVRALYRKGVKMTILAQVADNEAINVEKIPKEVRKWADYYLVEVAQKIDLISKISHFLFSQESVEVSQYRSLGFVAELNKIVAQNPPDIVQLEGLEMAAYRDEVSVEKCVLRIHGFESHKYNKMIAATKDRVRQNYYQVCKARLAVWEWKQVLSGKYVGVLLNDGAVKKAISAEMNTQITKKEAAKKAGKPEPPVGILPKIFTPIHGFDFNTIAVSENLEREPHSAYWLGSLDNSYSQNVLTWFITKIWEKVFAAYPHAKLYVAARYRSPNFLPAITATQGVYWEDNIAHLYDFMASKAIMVLPMLGYAGQQLKLLEAMAIGNAIVASAPAVLPIPAKQGAQLFIAQDEQAFIQQLSTLIEHPNIGAAMGGIAKEWVRKHASQESMDVRLWSFYVGC